MNQALWNPLGSYRGTNPIPRPATAEADRGEHHRSQSLETTDLDLLKHRLWWIQDNLTMNIYEHHHFLDIFHGKTRSFAIVQFANGSITGISATSFAYPWPHIVGGKVCLTPRSGSSMWATWCAVRLVVLWRKSIPKKIEHYYFSFKYCDLVNR